LHGAARNVASPAVVALANTLLAAMTGNLKALLAVVALACVTLAGAGVGAYMPSDDPVPVARKVEPPTPPVQVKLDKKLQHVDAFGDLLPEGALARLGTVRLRPNGA